MLLWLSSSTSSAKFRGRSQFRAALDTESVFIIIITFRLYQIGRRLREILWRLVIGVPVREILEHICNSTARLKPITNIWDIVSWTLFLFFILKVCYQPGYLLSLIIGTVNL